MTLESYIRQQKLKPQQQTDKWNSIKISNFCISQDTIKKVKIQPTESDKIFETLMKVLYTKYIKNFCNSLIKRQFNQKWANKMN